MSAYARYIGNYSGAETPSASLKGLRVYLAEGDALPVEVAPPPSPRKYWTRRGIAIDAIGNGRVMNDHRPWPRRVADSDLWCSLAEQLAEGRWTLFGLWSDLDAVHTALLDEVANRAAVVTHECPNGLHRQLCLRRRSIRGHPRRCAHRWLPADSGCPF